VRCALVKNKHSSSERPLAQAAWASCC